MFITKPSFGLNHYVCGLNRQSCKFLMMKRFLPSIYIYSSLFSPELDVSFHIWELPEKLYTCIVSEQIFCPAKLIIKLLDQFIKKILLPSLAPGCFGQFFLFNKPRSTFILYQYQQKYNVNVCDIKNQGEKLALRNSKFSSYQKQKLASSCLNPVCQRPCQFDASLRRFITLY